MGPLAAFEGGDVWIDHPYRDGVALIGEAAATSDPIYFDDPAARSFVRIDRALYERIRDGGVRL